MSPGVACERGWGGAATRRATRRSRRYWGSRASRTGCQGGSFGSSMTDPASDSSTPPSRCLFAHSLVEGGGVEGRVDEIRFRVARKGPGINVDDPGPDRATARNDLSRSTTTTRAFATADTEVSTPTGGPRPSSVVLVATTVRPTRPRPWYRVHPVSPRFVALKYRGTWHTCCSPRRWKRRQVRRRRFS